MRGLVLMAALAATPAFAEGCTVGKMAELPVTMRGMQPTIPIKINGEQMTFLADSGAFFSLISPASARQLGLKLSESPGNLRLVGVGGSTTTQMTTVDTLGFAGLDLKKILFLVAGSEVGGGNIGVIGQNVLGLADAEYDLAGGAIRLMKPHNCGKAMLAYWAKDKPVQGIALESAGPINRHIIGSVMVNGVKLKAMFDTGASTSMLTRAAAAKVGVKPGDSGVEEVGYSTGIGRRVVRSWIGRFKSFKIGEEEITTTKLRFSEVPDAAFDMLVGADFFLAHRIYVSNAQHMMYLTYNGGSVFQLDAKTPPSDRAPAVPDDAAPSDADGYSRRGSARASRRDYEAAIADFDKAVELAPSEPRFLVQRAIARLDLHQPLRAKTDLDAALKLAPGDVDALLARAGMYMRDQDLVAARADVDAAAKAAAHEADVRLRIAQFYGALRAPEPSIEQSTLWLEAHKVDSKRPEAFNSRCWMRALAGKDLAQALDDCNAALRERPKTASYLDSRGMVRLRMGDGPRAIADYDTALAIEPRIAWSLYGRGLARIRSGAEADGRKDIADALAIAPKLTEDARRYGIIPAEGPPR